MARTRQLLGVFAVQSGVAAVMLAGWWRSGHVVFRDAVSVPVHKVNLATFGLGSQPARAVPQDFLMALLSRVADTLSVDPALILKLLTWCALMCAGVGFTVWIHSMLQRHYRGGHCLPIAVGAGILAQFNPYVVERLLQGHWSLLWAVAASGWIIFACSHLARRTEGTWLYIGILCAALAASGLTPTGALIGTYLGCLTMGVERICGHKNLWALAVVAFSSAITSLPWLWVSVSSSTAFHSVSTGSASAFAARAEAHVATVGSLLSWGGIWNSHAVPPSRDTYVVPLMLCVWVAVLCVGVFTGRTLVRVWVGHSVLIVALLAIAATNVGLEAVEAVIHRVPAVGIVRDSHKWVLLAIPGMVLGFAVAASALKSRKLVAGLCVSGLGILSVPDGPSYIWKTMTPVVYDHNWQELLSVLTDDGCELGGAGILSLPAGHIRSAPQWAPAVYVDPLERMVCAETLNATSLKISGSGQERIVDGRTALPGKTLHYMHQQVLAGDREALEYIRSAGAGWIVVDTFATTQDVRAFRTLAGQEFEIVVDNDRFIAVKIRDAPPIAERSVTFAVITHLLWLVLGAGGVVVAVISAQRQRRACAAALAGSHSS